MPIAPRPSVTVTTQMSDKPSPSSNVLTDDVEIAQSLPSPILPQPGDDKTVPQDLNDSTDSLTTMEVSETMLPDNQPLSSTPDKLQQSPVTINSTKPILTLLLTEQKRSTPPPSQNQEGDTLVTIDLDTVAEIQQEVNRDTMPVASFASLPAQGCQYKQTMPKYTAEFHKGMGIGQISDFFLNAPVHRSILYGKNMNYFINTPENYSLDALLAHFVALSRTPLQLAIICDLNIPDILGQSTAITINDVPYKARPIDLQQIQNVIKAIRLK